MGRLDVETGTDEDRRRRFTKALLDEVLVLERMIRGGRIDAGPRRIGAEQEMFLVDGSLRPAPVATELLERAADPRLTTELARFNLEANLTPRRYTGRCLGDMEKELHEVVGAARTAAAASGARVLLTGILPTLRQSDLGLGNMTPVPRYHELNRAMTALRGGDFHVRIKGIDELDTAHDNVMLESCNTSFQIHFQVGPEEFARLYNLAQVVTAPLLAAAVNSPVLLGHRLWAETRVALFQASVDTRSLTAPRLRAHHPRVSFGDRWVDHSVLEIFRDDIARFRALLAVAVEEDAAAVLDAGGTPKLAALRLHNGTVYRWNRPCYGICDDVPHLRIECRVLPAGPTIRDEIANAALFFGLMSSLSDEFGDVREVMEFEDARANFLSAARYGLQAQFLWFKGRTRTASELLLDELLPRARAGLTSAGIDPGDIDLYTGVLQERIESGRTGSRWMIDSLAAMDPRIPRDRCHRALTATMLERQGADEPGHRWPLARIDDERDWHHSYRTVRQFMSTDLFTVQPDDLVDLAASMMDWERIRHVPVEDEAGRLVGVVSHRSVLRLVARGEGRDGSPPVLVRDIMKREPVTITPDTTTLDAMETMRRSRVGCLPVVEGDRLVGIVTERDLIAVAANLLERALREG